MNGKFSAERAALSHPLADGEGAPDEACTWRTSNEGVSGILTCDIGEDPEELRWDAGGNRTAVGLRTMSEETTQRGGVV